MEIKDRLARRNIEIAEASEGSKSKIAREFRDYYLAQCDWTQMPDSPLTTEQKAAWATYRQALRDVTAQEGFPGSIQWPVAP